MTRLTCRRCTHTWDYQGHRQYTTICPSCGGRVLLNQSVDQPVSLSAYMGNASPRRVETLRSVTNQLAERATGHLQGMDRETMVVLLEAIVSGVDRALERTVRQTTRRVPNEDRLEAYWRATTPALAPAALAVLNAFESSREAYQRQSPRETSLRHPTPRVREGKAIAVTPSRPWSSVGPLRGPSAGREGGADARADDASRETPLPP